MSKCRAGTENYELSPFFRALIDNNQSISVSRGLSTADNYEKAVYHSWYRYRDIGAASAENNFIAEGVIIFQ